MINRSANGVRIQMGDLIQEAVQGRRRIQGGQHGGIAQPGFTAGTCLRKDFAFSEERSNAPGMLLAVSRVNEAAQVLGDDKRRKEYEAELDGKAASVDVARIFAAEENFQRAEILIKARKYKEGLALLDEAIQLNDKEAEFYAWRGYARFWTRAKRETGEPR